MAECRKAFAFLKSRREATRKFMRRDTNRDGFVTRREFTRHRFPQGTKKLQRDFSLLHKLKDLGEDKQLTLREYLNVFARTN